MNNEFNKQPTFRELPLQHIELMPLREEMDNAYKRIYAEVIDMTDEAIYDAVIRMGKRLGITDLYLMDGKFVADALREKFEREYGRPMQYSECEIHEQ